MQPPHHGLAGLQMQHLRSASRFSAMLLSPSLSASGKAADPQMSSESYPGYPECVVSCHGAERFANSIGWDTVGEL